MAKKREKHREEFKRDAVRMMRNRGSRTVTEVADDLGVRPNVLVPVVGKARQRGGGQAQREGRDARRREPPAAQEASGTWRGIEGSVSEWVLPSPNCVEMLKMADVSTFTPERRRIAGDRGGIEGAPGVLNFSPGPFEQQNARHRRVFRGAPARADQAGLMAPSPRGVLHPQDAAASETSETDGGSPMKPVPEALDEPLALVHSRRHALERWSVGVRIAGHAGVARRLRKRRELQVGRPHPAARRRAGSVHRRGRLRGHPLLYQGGVLRL